jgi:tetratricopeptide (TPR) repeat protein
MSDDYEITLAVLGPVALSGELLPDTMACRLIQALAMVAPLPISTERLTRVMWNDDRPTTWGSSFRSHVASARKILADEKLDFSIQSNDGNFRLAGDFDRIDAVIFRRLIQQSDHERDLATKHKSLERALQFWRGEPAGLSEDSAAILGVDTLKRLARYAERTVLKARIADGHGMQVALELVGRFRGTPSSDYLAELLGEALLANESLEEAADVLASHRIELQKAGLEPGPAIQGLTHRLVSTWARKALVQATDGRQRRWEGANEVALVARTHMVRMGRESGFQIVLVQGEAGIGKSTLLTECATIESKTGIVLFSQAQENAIPFQSIQDLFAPWQAFLATARVSPDDLFLGVVDQEDVGPITIIIDDAHLLDLASVKLLQRAIGRGFARNVTLYLAARPNEGAPHVRRFMADLSNGVSTAKIELDPFTVEELTEFVRMRKPLLRGAEIRTLTNRLFELSAGMPLLSELLLAADFNFDEAREGLESHLEAEIDQLRPDHRSVLGTAALLGSRFDATSVAEAAGVTIAAVFDAMDAGYRAGLTGKRQGTTGRFRHELTRASLIAALGAQRRAVVSMQIAEVLEKREADLAVVAQHRAKSLVDATDPAAVRSLLEVAKQLASDLRWDDLERLLRLIEEAVVLQPWLGDAGSRFDCSFLYAQALQATGDWRVARQCFSAAFDLAREAGDIERMSAVAFESFGSNQPLDGDSQRLNWLRTVYELSPQWSESSIRAAAEHVYLDSLDTFSEFGRASVPMLLQTIESDAPDRVKGFAFHGLLAFDIGGADLARRRHLTEIALPLRERFEPEAAATVLLVSCAVSLQLGRLDMAQRRIDECRELSALRGRAGDKWIVHVSLATFAEWVGDHEEADRHVQIALDIAQQHDLPDGLASWLVFKVARAMRTDDWSLFLPSVPPLDDHFGEHPLDQLCLGLCVDAVSGQNDYPLDALTTAIDRLEFADRSVVWLPLLVAVCVAASRRGTPLDHVAADRCLTLLRPYEGTVLMTPFLASACFGPADRLLASLAAAATDGESAQQWNRSSERLCEQAGLSGWAHE